MCRQSRCLLSVCLVRSKTRSLCSSWHAFSCSSSTAGLFCSRIGLLSVAHRLSSPRWCPCCVLALVVVVVGVLPELSVFRAPFRRHGRCVRVAIAVPHPQRFHSDNIRSPVDFVYYSRCRKQLESIARPPSKCAHAPPPFPLPTPATPASFLLAGRRKRNCWL